MAVATALANADVTAGLGLGLFGVLSIIRLRSEELTQPDVVYYFAAITMGILGGIPIEPAWYTPVLMGALLGALYLGDHQALFGGSEQHTMVLDRAYPNREQLVARLEAELGSTVRRVTVKRIDLVNDTTTVDVTLSAQLSQRGSGCSGPCSPPHLPRGHQRGRRIVDANRPKVIWWVQTWRQRFSSR